MDILKILTGYWSIDDKDFEKELKNQIKENDYCKPNAAIIRKTTGEKLKLKSNGNYERV